MIAVIDYGMGNLRSVQKAFEAVGAKAVVTRKLSEILSASAVVLPGVGAYKDCMDNLQQLELVDAVHKSIQSGKPFLGICLGLQLLFHQSEEFGQVSGLEILPGDVVGFAGRIPDSENGSSLKVPHMGWNTVQIKKNNPLFKSIPNESYFYFVHSYYVVPQQTDDIATTTQYGIEFVSSIHHENIYAFQFHPEKSQKLGLTILKNFSELK
ncbi:MAG: imidazole glycerol phosphate synthase subunit HisH [Nitrospinae bacterium]|nr:imidazole glycerol phosphate synthase subunit HisH [Nitrospinota bacterium]MDA1109064.1 imidazole glycerol phosphate synthase subunit HisH [Nitrospinota bacterium]